MQKEEVGYRLSREEGSLPVSTLGFGVVLFLLQLYFYINFQSPGFAREVALIYMFIPLGFIGYSIKAQQTVERLKLGNMVIFGVLGFIITWATVLFFYGMVLGIEFGTTSQYTLYGTIATQVLFVAPSEELAFRTILPSYLESKFKAQYKRWRFLGLLTPQVLFALFHSSAYQWEWNAMVLAFIIGCIWMATYRIKIGGERLGLGFSMGSHACYNLVLVGVLSGNIAMVCGG